MAQKSKIAASRKSKATVGKRTAVVKKTARKSHGVKVARSTAGTFAKTAAKRTNAATSSSKSVVRRAMKAISAFAAPIIPSRESK
jgi:hypothetical protein